MKGRPTGAFFYATAAFYTTQMKIHKIPESVLVVIYTAAGDVLLIRRADAPDFWQSVTGSKDRVEESFRDTAVREVQEETGIAMANDAITRKDREIVRKRKVLEAKIASLNSEFESVEEELNKVYQEQELRKQVMNNNRDALLSIRRGADKVAE